MLVSIITATYNNQDTIQRAIESLKKQTYKNYEHIIIDGKSTDRTLEIVKQFSHIKKIISEKDKSIYEALNKGIRIAEGDIIGFLHADDYFYSDKTLETIVKNFTEDIDGIYGDLLYVSKQGNIIRYWKSENYNNNLLKKGWMPPHPTLFLRRQIYEKYGLFDEDFKIAGDYEFILKILTNGVKLKYIKDIITVMTIGGKSNKLSNILKKMKEDYKAIRRYKIGSINVLFLKNFSKINQLFKRKI